MLIYRIDDGKRWRRECCYPIEMEVSHAHQDHDAVNAHECICFSKLICIYPNAKSPSI